MTKSSIINKNLFINQFTESDQQLSVSEVEYWKNMIMKNLKNGVELESEFRNEDPIRDIGNRLKEKLSPTDSNSKFGEYGVHSIVGDGSLHHGLEIPMIGKRLDFWSNMENMKRVTDAMIEEGAYLHQRAGTHNHLLLSYQGRGNEAEKDMPGIIVRNFIQLIRRFASELVWLTSTNKGSNGEITRMENFRMTDALMRTTPTDTTRDVGEFLNKIGRVYPFVRTGLMKTNGNMITRFHLELRFPDCTLNPTQIVSQQVLFKSILLKAIEFSQYGIVGSAGTPELWEEQKALLSRLLASTNARLSRGINQEDKDELALRSQNMIMYFTNNIRQVEPLALEILEKLAIKPVSIRRLENDNLAKIEKDLMVKDERQKEQFEKIAKVIDSMSILGCDTKKEYEQELATVLELSYKMANHHLWKLGQVRKLEFDKKLGAMMFV